MQETPESIEEVIIEPNAEWHTANNKFGSKTWLAARGNALSSTLQTPNNLTHDPPKVQEKIIPTSSNVNKTPRGEIVIIDSEDEEEDILRRHATGPSSLVSRLERTDTGPANGMQNPQVRHSGMQSAIIDLTADSDTEDAPVPPLNKRKTSVEDGGPPLKRSRPELQQAEGSSALYNGGNIGNNNGVRSAR